MLQARGGRHTHIPQYPDHANRLARVRSDND
jgi:hypothetical protein